MYREERSTKRSKVDRDNRQSANGGVVHSSAAVVTEQSVQPVIQSTTTADVMPAYTYAPTWPGYTVRMSAMLCEYCVIFSYDISR